MKSKSGFTMVEILVVIAIFAILSAIAIPNYFSYRPLHRARGAARQLFTELHYAKMKAVSENKKFQIQYDASNDTYSIYCDDDHDGTPEKLCKTIHIRENYPNIEISSVTNAQSPPITRFYPNGLSKSDYVTKVKIRPVGDASREQVVAVSSTGRIKMN